MSDLIDRNNGLEAIDTAFFKTDPNSEEQLGFLTCRRIVREFPTGEAVEVVRCRGCANYTRSPFGHSFIGWCKLDGKHRRQNFYCADGEMKPK